MPKWLSIRALKVFLLFILIFALGKGSQFFIPIILSNILDPFQYGSLELAMSVGLIVVSITSLGSSAFISRNIVKKEMWINLDVVKLYLATMSILLMTLSISMYFMNNPSFIKISLSFSSILLLQGAISAELKSNSKRKSAIIIDMMLWATILAWAFLYISEAVSSANKSLIYILLMHELILLLFFLNSIDFSKIRLRLSPFRYFNEGSNIVAMSFISTIVATSGRLVVGNNLGLVAVAEYSSLYRISIVPIIVHQIIMLFFYRTSFSKSRKSFIYLGTITFILISCISLLAWFLALYFSPYLGLAFEASLQSNPVAFNALMISVPFWSAISINELAYSQNVKSRKPLFYSLAYVLLAYLSINYLVMPSNLDTASITVSIIIIGYYFISSLSLNNAGVTIARLPMLLSPFVLLGLLLHV